MGATKEIRIIQVYFHVLKLGLVFHSGDHQRTLEVAEAALPLTPGMYFITEHALDRSLARASLLAGAPPGEARDAELAKLRAEAESFRLWAEASPANHAHRQALIAAELAGLDGDQNRRPQSLRPGDPAGPRERLRSARGPGQRPRGPVSPPPPARAGRPWLRPGGLVRLPAVGRQAQAAGAHRAARGAGQRGSRRRRRDRAYGDRDRHDQHLLVARAGPGHGRARHPGAGRRAGARRLAGAADARSGRERRRPEGRAGAQSRRRHAGQAVEGRLEVEALVTVEPHRIQIGLRQPLETSTELAASVVQYVARSKETVVLGNAAAESRFARDPYIETQRPLVAALPGDAAPGTADRRPLPGEQRRDERVQRRAGRDPAARRGASGGRRRERQALRRAALGDRAAAADERHAGGPGGRTHRGAAPHAGGSLERDGPGAQDPDGPAPERHQVQRLRGFGGDGPGVDGRRRLLRHHPHRRAPTG